jgi:hypothetical protein
MNSVRISALLYFKILAGENPHLPFHRQIQGAGVVDGLVVAVNGIRRRCENISAAGDFPVFIEQNLES